MHNSPPRDPLAIRRVYRSPHGHDGSNVTRHLMMAVLSGTLGGSFQFGFSTGFVNNMSVYIKHYFIATGVDAATDPPEHFTLWWSIAVSGFAIGGMLGTLVFPEVASKIGRKKSILITTIFCYISCFLIAFPFSWTALITGRVLLGIGSGGACATVPTYITEIAPNELSGTLGTMHQLLITIGIFVAQAVSTNKFHLLGDDHLWQFSLLIPFACTTFLLATMPLCADSPAYLLKNVGEEAAKDALRWFRPATEYASRHIYHEIKMFKKELALCDRNATIRDVLKDELLWKPLIVASVVNLSMQFSGIDAVFYYSTNVFVGANIPLEYAQVCTTVVGFCNVAVTIPAMLFMDKAGRKTIQCIGLSGMSVSYVIMTFAMVMECHVLCVIGMVLIIMFFAFGPGCIAWFIIAELVPLHARAISTTVALMVNWTANWIIAMVFPQILAQLHKWTFGVFAVSTAVLALYTLLCLPETKGKTVLEIREEFSSGNLLKVPSMPNLLRGRGLGSGGNISMSRPLLGNAQMSGSVPDLQDPRLLMKALAGKAGLAGKQLFKAEGHVSVCTAPGERLTEAVLARVPLLVESGDAPVTLPVPGDVLEAAAQQALATGPVLLSEQPDGSGDVAVIQTLPSDDDLA